MSDPLAVEVVDLTPERVAAAAHAVTEAFFTTDPHLSSLPCGPTLLRWVAAIRTRRLRAHLAAGKPAYVAVAGDEVVGLVAFGPPHPLPAPRARQAGDPLPPGGEGAAGMRTWLPRSSAAGGRCWTIGLLGVRSDWQGRGVGTSLMLRAHARCDRDPTAQGVRLFTSGRRNRSFYERLGYRVSRRVRLGWLEFYWMARQRA